eukprot:1189863-Prorocentrum_minimum.AAC.3
MGGRSVPSSVAEPLFAVRCVAPHHARRVVNPAVSAGVFRQVSQGRAIRGLLLEGLLELQRAYSRGHLITLYVNPGEWPTLGLGGIQRTYSALFLQIYVPLTHRVISLPLSTKEYSECQKVA